MGDAGGHRARNQAFWKEELRKLCSLWDLPNGLASGRVDERELRIMRRALAVPPKMNASETSRSREQKCEGGCRGFEWRRTGSKMRAAS